MTTDNLAACPFCGANGVAAVYYVDLGQGDFREDYYVHCANADCRVSPRKECGTPHEAAAIWNTRPAPAITDGMVEAGAKAIIDFKTTEAGVLAVFTQTNMDIHKGYTRSALTAALPHAVDAAGVYNQAVEDCANILWIGEKPPLEVPEYNGNRDDYERDVLNWSDYCHAQQIRALKNPTATAPDAAAIRREVVEKTEDALILAVANCIEIHFEGRSGYWVPVQHFEDAIAIADDVKGERSALAAGKGV